MRQASARAWIMLVVSVIAQASATMFVSAPAFLIPHLHEQQGISLAAGGMVASAPTLGLVLTLVVWGSIADRYGERVVIAVGLALTAIAAWGASTTTELWPLAVWFFVGGAVSASVNAASGRVVIGWFPRHRRGLAMGIRQMSPPLGISGAALLIPPLLEHHGIGMALAVTAVLNAVFAVLCAVIIKNPPAPRTENTAQGEAAARTVTNPYRVNSFLWRIHAVSILLVIPQFALSIFGIVWLVTDLQWNPTAAGLLITVAQFTGAVSRMVIGAISDRVGTRVGVIRIIAFAGCLTMLAVAAAGLLRIDAIVVVVFIAATVVSVADNGVAFIAVAEAAGHWWAGRALGVQNTGQFLLATVVGPGFGALIATVGTPWAFAALTLAPAAAIPLIPREDHSVLADQPDN
ncbi:MFS transporter [Microbacterium sp. YY-01]|uniref:MFS transporter n=1 Tax=Microbacterium sp. YY-01 TaxID=3421634 RepID=UPI003D186813